MSNQILPVSVLQLLLFSEAQRMTGSLGAS